VAVRNTADALPNRQMRIALVHDWLTGMRGGEKVLAAIAELFPQADIFTLVHVRGSCPQLVKGRRVITSMLDDLPGVGHYYRHLLPAMPLAIERLDLGGYDLIISSSHCVAKGVCRDAGALHICYCHTPMRYIWAQNSAYASRMSRLNAIAMAFFRRYLQAWDLRSAGHVDLYLANSHNVARRIERIYGFASRVVWPPIDTEYFTPDGEAREDFYLVMSALAPYKCVDHAVAAFSRLNLPLRVIGSGQMLHKLRRLAPRNVQFLGWQSDEVVREHYRRCKALVFPGEEDFGMVPVETMACGAPVIAYKAGGALETVIDVGTPDARGPTGLLYEPHTIEAMVDAVRRFENMSQEFSQEKLAAWARNFGKQQFRRRFLTAIDPELRKKGMRPPCLSATDN